MARTRKQRPAPDAIVLAEAEEPKVAPKPAGKPDLAKVHETAMKRWRRADEADRENRNEAYADLEFLEVPGAQWGDDAKKLRDGRPCLEFNRLPTTIAQITGDIRQMRPAVKVVPVDSRGDPDTADVIAGMVRYVENRSDAASAYFAAADQQVACGIGGWRVETEYGSDSTFEQEIRVSHIPDGIGIRFDPDARLPTREDGLFCFVPVDLSRDVFEEKYPDATASEIGDSDLAGRGLSEWATHDTVRIAEYWTKRPVKKTLALMPDGEILDLTDKSDPEHAERLARAEAEGARIEQRDGHQVERYLITATEVLEGPTPWPGRFIPIVPVLGVEMQIGRKRVRRGVVRNAKDAQRAYNYARSTEIEVVALQPKAPFIGTEKQFKGYETIWNTANTELHPYLPYGHDPQAPGPPQRVQPPVGSAGLQQNGLAAAEDLKAITGVYDASLGARSNETSGKAIQARQREGDVGSFVYIVNFSRSIRHTGAIIVDLVPHIYDTARTIRVVGEDGKVDRVEINKVSGLADDDTPLDKIQNDVTVGAYDVAMEMGPSYTTRREAALDGMIALVQAAPDLAPMILDLLAKAQDWPMADKIAARIRTMLPPQIQALEAQEAGEPLPPPMPPSPQEQAAMAQQERQQQLDAGRQQLDMEKLDVEREKLRADLIKVQAEIERATIEASRPPEPPQGAMHDGVHNPGADSAISDPRVDALGAAVEQLSGIVVMLLEEMPGAPPPVEPEGPPLAEPPPLVPPDLMTAEPPPGGFSFDPAALALPAPEMMGQP